MFRNAFYRIIGSDHQDGIITATLEINKNNEIFAGHFPGQPVLPGACMLQMLKEVLEINLNIKMRLKKAQQVRYPTLIDPMIDNILQLTIKYIKENEVTVSGNLTGKNGICLKFKGIFIDHL